MANSNSPAPSNNLFQPFPENQHLSTPDASVTHTPSERSAMPLNHPIEQQDLERVASSSFELISSLVDAEGLVEVGMSESETLTNLSSEFAGAVLEQSNAWCNLDNSQRNSSAVYVDAPSVLPNPGNNNSTGVFAASTSGSRQNLVDQLSPLRTPCVSQLPLFPEEPHTSVTVHHQPRPRNDLPPDSSRQYTHVPRFSRSPHQPGHLPSSMPFHPSSGSYCWNNAAASANYYPNVASTSYQWHPRGYFPEQVPMNITIHPRQNHPLEAMEAVNRYIQRKRPQSRISLPLAPPPELYHKRPMVDPYHVDSWHPMPRYPVQASPMMHLPEVKHTSFNPPSVYMSSSEERNPQVLNASAHHQAVHPVAENPPSAPLLCTVCNDLASGKHYGAQCCEGCKGFFRRTVRKELSFTCHGDKDCTVDKRTRIRCQYCRYQKCLSAGMRREAVQEERQFYNHSGSTSSPTNSEDGDLTPGASCVDTNSSLAKILAELLDGVSKAERFSGQLDTSTPVVQSTESGETNSVVVQNNQESTHRRRVLQDLFNWSEHLPVFKELPSHLRVILLKSAFVELSLAQLVFQVLLSPTQTQFKHSATFAMFTSLLTSSAAEEDRLSALIHGTAHKLQSLRLDPMECGFIKLIHLLDPDAVDASSRTLIQQARDLLCSALDYRCNQLWPTCPHGRMGRLLLRLSPALRLLAKRVQALWSQSPETFTQQLWQVWIDGQDRA